MTTNRPDYTALDEAILKHLSLNDRAHPMSVSSIKAIAQTFVHGHRLTVPGIIDARMDALRLAGRYSYSKLGRKYFVPELD